MSDILGDAEKEWNCTLSGSIGHFRIGTQSADKNNSCKVTYLETHIGFDSRIPANETMLKELRPFREIFDFQKLDFAQIMQRDIDDARVSTELIPYLLDSHSQGTIKFFPPIVIVVLPIKNLVLEPENLYPKIKPIDYTDEKTKTKYKGIRSGENGEEIFEFSHPLYANGNDRLHDLAKLKIDVNKVRLVILDGQHRAMALLALYRNLRDEWNEAKRAPFKNYYREWTKENITKFNLNEVQLPVVICTFPDLDTSYKGDFTIIQATRSLFLTLNKTARVVSNSRNILLDDRDLISYFLRDCLGKIKSANIHSKSSLRIWDVELDQYRDRIKIESPVACTGVTHIHYIIEHLMLEDGDINGYSSRSGKFYKRMYVEAGLLRRLDGKNLIGSEAANSLRRTSFSADSAKILSEAFMKKYGQHIIDIFDKFGPFNCHNLATMESEKTTSAHSDPQLKTILFDGQNVHRTFSDYLDHMLDLERKAKDSDSDLPPEMQLTLNSLKNTKKAFDEATASLASKRISLMLEKVSDKSKLKDKDGNYEKFVAKSLNDLYSNVFFSVAFQAALICGFFHIFEKSKLKFEKENSDGLFPSLEDALSEYLEILNCFFLPESSAKLKNLFRVFSFEVKGDKASEWEVSHTGDTFSSVVYRSEMKPDEWPKYRYLILEIWRPKNHIALSDVISEERFICRNQVFESLYKKNKEEVSSTVKKAEKDFTDKDWDSVFNKTFQSFDAFLKNLGLKNEERLQESALRELVKKPSEKKEEADEMDDLEPTA